MSYVRPLYTYTACEIKKIGFLLYSCSLNAYLVAIFDVGIDATPGVHPRFVICVMRRELCQPPGIVSNTRAPYFFEWRQRSCSSVYITMLSHVRENKLYGYRKEWARGIVQICRHHVTLDWDADPFHVHNLNEVFKLTIMCARIK